MLYYHFMTFFTFTENKTMKREELIKWLSKNVNVNFSNLTDDILPAPAFEAGWMVVPSGDTSRHFKLMGTNETIYQLDVFPPKAEYDFSTELGMMDWLRNNLTRETWAEFTGYNLPEDSAEYGWCTHPDDHSGLMEVFSDDLRVAIVRDTVFPPDVEQFIINNPELAEVARENSPVEPELVEEYNPWNGQVGGAHYKSLTIQPLQFTLGAKGYEAFAGACHNHIARYTTRIKDDETVQLEKAKHILELWIYESKKQAEGK